MKHFDLNRQVSKPIIFSVSLLMLCQLQCQAKIGESFAGYRARVASKYTFRTQEAKGAQTYYRFAYPLTPEEGQRCPGFGTGITITVAGGKIVGQSMAVRMGDAYDESRSMASRRALDFILEAIGKAKSASPTEDAQQLASIKSAIEQALISNPQNIQFPGFPQRAKLSCSSTGDLLVAVLPPAQTAPPGSYIQ